MHTNTSRLNVSIFSTCRFISCTQFGRVGGGIYTKVSVGILSFRGVLAEICECEVSPFECPPPQAADVGADLVGKVVHGIPEDDPRNPGMSFVKSSRGKVCCTRFLLSHFFYPVVVCSIFDSAVQPPLPTMLVTMLEMSQVRSAFPLLGLSNELVACLITHTI